MSRLTLGTTIEHAVVIENVNGRLELGRLFGFATAADEGKPDRARGLAVLCSDKGRMEGPSLVLKASHGEADRFDLEWETADRSLRLKSSWAYCTATGVLSRKDCLINTADTETVVHRCLARFTFAPGRYEVYAQDSRWSNENQGEWAPLRTGSMTFGGNWGRTTEGNAPYVCLREIGTERGVAFHVVPEGNWVIRIGTHPYGRHLPWVVVEIGLADEDLHLRVAPGETLELPEILVQELPGGEPQRAAPRLHRYVNERSPASLQSAPPIVYNTWFDQFSTLDVPRLREHLRAAKELGCEVFVIDAGWFGASGSGWSDRGNWQEKPDEAFCGKMTEFADEVRSAGLGFGLWMEPEYFAPTTPIAKQHPEWFVHGHRIDLEKEDAYEYLRTEIARLVETYKLRWMKIDFNAHLGYDPSGAEHLRYYRQWYRLLDEVRRRHPQLCLENCASGGMRLDLRTFRHFDTHFLSDTVHPVDVLRIAQGMLLRFPPGRVGRWTVLRCLGSVIPQDDTPAGKAPPSVIVPGGATWRLAERTDLDFALAVGAPGVMGFSGDFLACPPVIRQRVAWYVEFAKRWRPFITASVAHLLTPVRPLQDRQGWIAWQLQAPDTSASLVFVYQLGDGPDTQWFPLFGLDPGAMYAVLRETPDGGATERHSGAELMHDGLCVKLSAGFHADHKAAIVSVQPDGRAG